MFLGRIAAMRNPAKQPFGLIINSDLRDGIHSMAPGISLRIIATALGPFALGYLLSYLLRAVNAVVAPDLVLDLGLSPAELGLLTSAYSNRGKSNGYG